MSKIEISKLKESIPTNGIKIIDLYNKIDNELLDVQPKFQRKLVWKKQHKYAFIETILLNYPFPEVYIASAEIDIDRMIASEIVVDGQQRLNTIVEYIKGEGDFQNQRRITPFDQLSPVEKKEFLNYKVSVKDLKDIGEEVVKEIFKRINSTEYSLNVVERNNAQYGDGEIAMFCKQLINVEFMVTEQETDILIQEDVRKEIYTFFESKCIFTENDKKRMYDFQYMMLLSATILEGIYPGRSSIVDVYLEDFNSEFSAHSIVLEKLLKAIRAIDKIGLSKQSYWFNKANLYTIIIELSQIETSDLEYDKLEAELLDLENKQEVYFSAESDDDIKHILEEERKYFEVARHGSHEKAARDHRGNVIKKILTRCLNGRNKSVDQDSIEIRNIRLLADKKIDFVTITPTETGLSKSIMDATSPIREFLKEKEIHDYSIQENGPDHKVLKTAHYLKQDEVAELNISLYRATRRGDARIWLSDLNHNAKANDNIAIIVLDGQLYVINLSVIDLDAQLEVNNPVIKETLKI